MTSLLPTRSTALIAAAAVMLAATAAAAHDFTLGALTLDHPWARASAGPARNGAAFLAIENAGDADRLLGATGDIAERIELHTHEMDGDVMKMRRLEAVEIPAHDRSEEHTSELQSLMRNSYAVFCLKKKTIKKEHKHKQIMTRT